MSTVASLLRLSPAERQTITLIAATHKGFTVNHVDRHSDHEFDLTPSGTLLSCQTNPDGTPIPFRAWLPTMAIAALVNMGEKELQDMTAYPQRLIADPNDWSAIRDSPNDAKWEIFQVAVVKRLLR